MPDESVRKPEMNKASIIRYGAATAIGLVMSAALLSAATMHNRAGNKAREARALSLIHI